MTYGLLPIQSYSTANDGDNRWSRRRALMFRFLNREAPDVIGVQEALRPQLDEILAHVPGLGEVGEGRDGGTDGEYSALLFRKDRFDVADQGTFWLSRTPEKVSRDWGSACVRVCTWARGL